MDEGGACLTVDGLERALRAAGPDREDAKLYARFAELLRSENQRTDPSPMRHAADAFTPGRRIAVEPFDW